MASQFALMGERYPCFQLDQNFNIQTANPPAQQLQLPQGFFRALLTEQECAWLQGGQPLVVPWGQGASGASMLSILPQRDGYIASLVAPASRVSPARRPDADLQSLEGMAEDLQGQLTTLPTLPLMLEKEESVGLDVLEYNLRKGYRLLRTVKDRLWSERLGRGYLPQWETLDLNEHLGLLCQAVRTAMPDIELQYEGCAGPVWVRADRDLLDLIVTHLINNSLSYAGEDNTISLQVQPLRERVVVHVLDRGLGLKPQVAAHAFEAFFSSDPYCDTTTAPGDGLGLFLVRQALRLLGGECALESEFGYGARVSFLLPLAPNGAGAVHCRLMDYLADRFSCVYLQLGPLGAQVPS